MANEIITNVRFHAEDPAVLKTFVGHVRGFGQAFSFNGICEMPLRLRDRTHTSFGPMAYNAWYGDGQFALGTPWARERGLVDLKSVRDSLQNAHPEAIDEAAYMLQSEKLCGYTTDSSWALANWGVAGDALFPECLRLGLNDVEWQFTTKHDFPEQLFAMMVKQYPEIAFSGSFFSDADDFAGEFAYEPGGELSIVNDEEIRSEESVELLSAIKTTSWF